MKKKSTSAVRAAFILIALSLIGNSAIAQPNITLGSFTGVYNSPVQVLNCGDNRLFVVERAGRIMMCDVLGQINNTPFIDLHDRVNQSGDERGLLGMVFHPEYHNNGYFYVNYVSQSGTTRISRFTRSTADTMTAVKASELILIEFTQPYTNHNGGWLGFGPQDGFLYIALGDGGSAGDPGNRAQDKSVFFGKILRIDVDHPSGGKNYGIPSSNPFTGNPNAAPEVWAYGLRNPWRCSFDRFNGDLWIGDVGQDQYEEIDYHHDGSPNGQNFGWRCYEGSHEYNTSSNCPAKSSLTMPVYNYAHGIAAGCSVIGGFVYRGGRYGALFGKYIFADYCSGKLRMINRNSLGKWEETDLLYDNGNNQIVSFGEDKDGELLACFIKSGNIKKMTVDVCQPTAFIRGSDNVTKCDTAKYVMEAVYGKYSTYLWYRNGSPVSGSKATKRIYKAHLTGAYTVLVTNNKGCTAMSNTINVTFINCRAGNLQDEPISFELVPNPADNIVTISMNGLTGKAHIITITDMLGKKVTEITITTDRDGQAQYTLDVSSWQKGIYNLVLNSGNKINYAKLVVE